jgi:hypothetical protein
MLEIIFGRRCVFATSVALCVAASAHADEGGVSFWLPGQQSNFATAPGEPGWSMHAVYFHTSSDAGLSREFVVGGNLVAGLDAQADLVLVAPTYTFANTVMGGQGSSSLAIAIAMWPLLLLTVAAVSRGQIIASAARIATPPFAVDHMTVRHTIGGHRL